MPQFLPLQRNTLAGKADVSTNVKLHCDRYCGRGRHMEGVVCIEGAENNLCESGWWFMGTMRCESGGEEGREARVFHVGLKS